MTELVSRHQPERSPPRPLPGPHHPVLLHVQVDVPAVDRVEGVGQNTARAIKRIPIAVIPVTIIIFDLGLLFGPREVISTPVSISINPKELGHQLTYSYGLVEEDKIYHFYSSQLT